MGKLAVIRLISSIFFLLRVARTISMGGKQYHRCVIFATRESKGNCIDGVDRNDPVI